MNQREQISKSPAGSGWVDMRRAIKTYIVQFKRFDKVDWDLMKDSVTA